VTIFYLKDKRCIQGKVGEIGSLFFYSFFFWFAFEIEKNFNFLLVINVCMKHGPSIAY
jgi:hypothetical protein